MLPNVRREPPGAAMSTGVATTGGKPGKRAASSANWSSPSLPLRVEKFAATSCRQRTSKSAKARACSTIRCGSTRPSQPRHHWMFQVTSFIDSFLAGSADPGAHERLDELALEQQEPDQERRRR